MTFKDIFKSSFLESVIQVSVLDIVIALIFSFAIGLFIFYVYKKTFNGVMYSSGFSVTLIGLTLITTVVILAVTSNVVLSLGMVGALSIVRFRTAIKEPLDIAFLFWSIAAGIVVGAGLVSLAVVGSLVIGIVLLVFANRQSSDCPYILVVSCQNDSAEKSVLEQVKSGVKKYVVKTKTVSAAGLELTIEVRLKDESTGFVNQIAHQCGVESAVLVSYNGDYMS